MSKANILEEEDNLDRLSAHEFKAMYLISIYAKNLVPYLVVYTKDIELAEVVIRMANVGAWDSTGKSLVDRIEDINREIKPKSPEAAEAYVHQFNKYWDAFSYYMPVSREKRRRISKKLGALKSSIAKQKTGDKGFRKALVNFDSNIEVLKGKNGKYENIKIPELNARG